MSKSAFASLSRVTGVTHATFFSVKLPNLNDSILIGPPAAFILTLHNVPALRCNVSATCRRIANLRNVDGSYQCSPISDPLPSYLCRIDALAHLHGQPGQFRLSLADAVDPSALLGIYRMRITGFCAGGQEFVVYVSFTSGGGPEPGSMESAWVRYGPRLFISAQLSCDVRPRTITAASTAAATAALALPTPARRPPRRVRVRALSGHKRAAPFAMSGHPALKRRRVVLP